MKEKMWPGGMEREVPKRWLTEHRPELPFLREYVPGGTVRVSAKALARWLATR